MTARIQDLSTSRWFPEESIFSVPPPDFGNKNEIKYRVVVIAGIFKRKQLTITVSRKHYLLAKDRAKYEKLFEISKSSPVPADSK